MSLSKRQQREQETRQKRLNRRKMYTKKRQEANRNFHMQKQINKLLQPGITIRNPPKEVQDEGSSS